MLRVKAGVGQAVSSDAAQREAQAPRPARERPDIQELLAAYTNQFAGAERRALEMLL